MTDGQWATTATNSLNNVYGENLLRACLHLTLNIDTGSDKNGTRDQRATTCYRNVDRQCGDSTLSLQGIAIRLHDVRLYIGGMMM
jgi:hypothetical protein